VTSYVLRGTDSLRAGYAPALEQITTPRRGLDARRGAPIISLLGPNRRKTRDATIRPDARLGAGFNVPVHGVAFGGVPSRKGEKEEEPHDPTAGLPISSILPDSRT
jgi:hypothetical protein